MTQAGHRSTSTGNWMQNSWWCRFDKLTSHWQTCTKSDNDTNNCWDVKHINSLIPAWLILSTARFAKRAAFCTNHAAWNVIGMDFCLTLWTRFLLLPICRILLTGTLTHTWNETKRTKQSVESQRIDTNPTTLEQIATRNAEMLAKRIHREICKNKSLHKNTKNYRDDGVQAA